MAGPEVWQQLSRSSKDALRWAGAAALARAERTGSSLADAEVDEFDLLVGIMLADPVDSDFRALLEELRNRLDEKVAGETDLAIPAERVRRFSFR